MNVKKLNEEINNRKRFIFEIVVPDIREKYSAHDGLMNINRTSSKASSVRNMFYESQRNK